jgi:phage gp29-like protein
MTKKPNKGKGKMEKGEGASRPSSSPLSIFPSPLLKERVAGLNRWREQYNPLRGLTMPLAVGWLEQYQRGWMADLQWAYNFIEQTDADLLALVERRTSAVLALDWDIRITEEERTGFDQALANAQAAFLRSAYERVDNLYEAIEHLAMATFRGYAHLEKHAGANGIEHLEVLDQWNVIRDGLYGDWKYNPEAKSCDFQALPAENLILPENWLIRMVKRPVDRIGLMKFIRSNLSQKDWDVFIEIYGLPAAVIIGPPNIPPGKEEEYQTSAANVAEGVSGYLPNGADVKFATEARGMQPFREHLRYWQEQLILAGTGGLLTMLAQSGSGTLAGGAHEDTFDLIARSEARKISEVFQTHLDQPLLEAQFPGKPRLAYFSLASAETIDTGAVVDQALKLKQAGYEIDPAELSERTGYSLTKIAAPIPNPSLPGEQGQTGVPSNETSPLANRLAIPGDNPAALDQLARTAADDLGPVVDRLERILRIEDPEIFKNKLAALKSELPALLKDINADPASARTLDIILRTAFLRGARKGQKA